MPTRVKVLVIAAVVLLIVAGSLLIAHTFLLSPYTMTQGRQIGANVSVSGNVPRSIEAATTDTPGAPFTTVKPLGPVIQITPAGKLPSTITLRFKLSRQVQGDEAVLAATSETTHGPWTLVPSSTSKDGWYVIVQTDHLSFWQAWL